MLYLTIYMTPLAQGIKRQSGPVSKRSTLLVLMCDCNGHGDPKKHKRVLIKLDGMVNKGCIIFLQETHIVSNKYLEMIWNHTFMSNCLKINSARVIIIYNKKYDLVPKHSDGESRNLITVIGNEERKFIVVNAYFTNDHKQGITLAEQMYTKIFELYKDLRGPSCCSPNW
jgi:hypothetical protein